MRPSPTLPAGFVGELADISFPGPRGTADVLLGIPLSDMDRFMRQVGIPPGPSERARDEAYPLALLLPCPRPEYPDTEETAMTIAAIDFVERAIADRSVPFRPILALRLARLRAILQGDIVGGTQPTPTEPAA